MNLDNIMAERIVVGTLMNNPDWMVEIKDLQPEFFFNPTNRILFSVIKNVYDNLKGDAIDPFTLSSYARNENIYYESAINDSGGLEYLQTLQEISIDYTVQDLKNQAEIIKTLAFMRDIVKNSERIIDYIQNGEYKSIENVKEKINESQKKIMNKFTIRDSYSWVGEIINETLDSIKERVKDGIVGYPSKLKTLNKYMTYRNGELAIFGARAKGGKSTFAMNEAHYLSVKKNIPVLYLDTEMQTSTFIVRMIALDTGLPIRTIETFEYLNNERQKRIVEESIERIKKAPLIHKYSNNWTKEKVKNDVIALKRNFNIEVVVYDYIKVKEVANMNTPEHNELGNWAIFLKDLAGELNIPIISMAQMSPYEVRLADSDKLNRYASTVAFILPLSDNLRNKLIQRGCRNTKDYIFIQYNRNGASMVDPERGVYVDYTRDIATFEEAIYQEDIEDISR